MALLGRREVRILIVQTLFENDFNDKESSSVVLIETFNTLAREHNPALVDNDFSKQVLKGVASKYDEINRIIEQASIDWSLDRIGNVDRNILRLGVFELLFGREFEVPERVALNEAIEITKIFLNDSARKFINGVLGAVYAEIKDPNEDDFVPKKIRQKKSVGGVVFKIDEGGNPYFAFVHDVFGKWTLSKGGLENAESVEDGLRRVVREEIDLGVEILEKIGSNSYIAHPPDGPVRKEVIYLLAKTNDPVLHLREEKDGLDEAKWFTYDEAKELAFYPDLKQIILNGMTKAVNEYARQ